MPLIDKGRVARQFDRHASTYDRHASVQRRMARGVARAASGLVPGPRAILEVGCGTGLLTTLLARGFPHASVTAVDLSEAMLARARARLDGAVESGRVRLAHADAEAVAWPNDAFDLVVSSAVVQWLSAPGPTTTGLAGALAPGGAMVHATFGPGTFRELHATFEEVERERGVEPRLHGLGLASAATWRERLEAAGLADVSVAEDWQRVLYPSCLALLDSIRRTGASHVEPGVRRSPAVLREVARRYDAARRGDGAGVLATYQVLTVTGRRPAA